MRVPAIEAALKANWSPSAIDSVSISASNLLADIHGTAEYRANLIKVMAQRAVTAAGVIAPQHKSSAARSDARRFYFGHAARKPLASLA